MGILPFKHIPIWFTIIYLPMKYLVQQYNDQIMDIPTLYYVLPLNVIYIPIHISIV